MSTFQSSLAFFVELGIYDVVLPFLLIFTIVFAMLEKTKVFGTEDGYTKKNLNAMVAFVSGFLVVVSTELVRIINTVVANVVLLLLLSVLFMLLAGSFSRQEEDGFELSEAWRKFLIPVVFCCIGLIFLHTIGWLEFLWNYMIVHIDGPVVGSFLMLGVLIGGIYFIAGFGGGNDNNNESKS